MWVGFEDGHLLVLDATSRRLLAQAWLQHFSSINCILHIQVHVFVQMSLSGARVCTDESVMASVTVGQTCFKCEVLIN